MDNEWKLPKEDMEPRTYYKICILCGKDYETKQAFSKICFDCNTRKKTKKKQKCKLCDWDIICFKYTDGYNVWYFCPNHHWEVTRHIIDLNGNKIEKTPK